MPADWVSGRFGVGGGSGWEGSGEDGRRGRAKCEAACEVVRRQPVCFWGWSDVGTADGRVVAGDTAECFEIEGHGRRRCVAGAMQEDVRARADGEGRKGGGGGVGRGDGAVLDVGREGLLDRVVAREGDAVMGRVAASAVQGNDARVPGRLGTGADTRRDVVGGFFR